MNYNIVRKLIVFNIFVFKVWMATLIDPVPFLLDMPDLISNFFIKYASVCLSYYQVLYN